MAIEFLTTLLVIITAIYAYLTYRLAKASEASVESMQEQSEALVRPYVTIQPFVRPHTSILYLRIKNVGRTNAINLKLSIDRDFYQFGETNSPEKNLKSLSAFTSPIDSFAPDAELLFALAQGWVIFGDDGKQNNCPSQFTVTASYEFGERQVTETSQIDLRPYYNSEGYHDPLVEEINKIRVVLEKSS